MKMLHRNKNKKYYSWLKKFIIKHQAWLNQIRFELYDTLPLDEAYFLAFYTDNPKEAKNIKCGGSHNFILSALLRLDKPIGKNKTLKFGASESLKLFTPTQNNKRLLSKAAWNWLRVNTTNDSIEMEEF